jgi:hypothetical protein
MKFRLTVSAYMTLAPPPATIVQMRPFGFSTVNFREALVCKKRNGSYRTVKIN